MLETLTDTTIETKQEILITQKAINQIEEIRKKENLTSDFALRIGVKGGGCSGFSYVLGFDNEQHHYDKVLQSNGVTIYIDEKSLMYLAGTELDFQDGLNGKGFVFNNPNAAKTCGCGSSFAV
ncbi:MAG: iron-sulfur cluster insertion protein ErpA [Ignavibacteriae bacterium]|nr:iron-sulfur cluster insertion protein ErpA [Ignavibacteriota bacterium]